MEAGKVNHEPVFSIVMPVYNAEKYLEKSLGSILHQTFSDFELILVNDASTDSSLAICKKFADSDWRIALIDNPENCGAAEARNQGIKAAKGRHFCFVDADDYIEPGFLTCFYDALQENDYDFVKCGAYEEYYDFREKLLYSRPCCLPEKEYRGTTEIAEQVIDMELIPLFGYIWNGVYKVSTVKDNGLWFDRALKVNEDFAFNIRYLPFVKKMKCLSYCGYHYAKRDSDSLSSTNKYYDFETHLMKIRDLLVLLRNNQVETQINLDKVFWVFTRFTLSALEAGTSLEIIRKEELFARYLKHRFGPLGIKKKVLTGILQSDNAFIIKPAVCLIGFIKQYLPVVFAKVKK